MTSGFETALAEASSPSWPVRARAGRDLASFADAPEAAEALARLLLDSEDTAVTRRTAEALARVGTPAATRLIALALSEADDNQAEWIWTGMHDALMEPDGASAEAPMRPTHLTRPFGALPDGGGSRRRPGR
ncbi:HEAT repeat domain-containing protein [Streptomyces amakusaensis]|uniref:HEAT repeat domain-containing protein n=1 Tax=Streptomyces amakusaensis TaxID=67271 RepID=A0ABW0AKP0_9ACTN